MYFLLRSWYSYLCELCISLLRTYNFQIRRGELLQLFRGSFELEHVGNLNNCFFKTDDIRFLPIA